MKAIASLPNKWISNPAVDLTFIALWIFVFSFSQLKKDSIGSV
ncbi:MAG: hypothetical protein H6Q17_759 [Bacteroidetes bacterium]|nr:hypothetical protein [Bacteroidota bacterium]